jgi:hypothetical protein
LFVELRAPSSTDFSVADTDRFFGCVLASDVPAVASFENETLAPAAPGIIFQAGY